MGRPPVPAETHAIFGMLRDKDRHGFLARIQGLVDHWHVTGLPGSRGTAASLLARRSPRWGDAGSLTCYYSAEAALRGVQARARRGDRVLVTGSFLTVAGVLPSLP